MLTSLSGSRFFQNISFLRKTWRGDRSRPLPRGKAQVCGVRYTPYTCHLPRSLISSAAFHFQTPRQIEPQKKKNLKRKKIKLNTKCRNYFPRFREKIQKGGKLIKEILEIEIRKERRGHIKGEHNCKEEQVYLHNLLSEICFGSFSSGWGEEVVQRRVISIIDF